MYRWACISLLAVCGIWGAAPVRAQLPFYTDDPALTEPGTLQFECFNEFDSLPISQYPNLFQNIANVKLNYGLPYHLELDRDAPYRSIFRALAILGAKGPEDTNMGVKWKFRGDPAQIRLLPVISRLIYLQYRLSSIGELHD